MGRLAVAFIATWVITPALAFVLLVVGVGSAGPSISDGEQAVMVVGALEAALWLGSTAAYAVAAALIEAPTWAKVVSVLVHLLGTVGAFVATGFTLVVLLNR